MHYSAKLSAQAFFDVYSENFLSAEETTVVELGSAAVNGSIRPCAPKSFAYFGLDIINGDSVNVIIDDSLQLPVKDNSVDIILCSSLSEHTTAFWEVFLQCCRALKPGGLLYVNAPSNGFVHRYPIDAWRFYPDAGSALAAWARYSGVEISLVESFIGRQRRDKGLEGYWNDFVAIFFKGADVSGLTARRILKQYPDLQFQPKDIAASTAINRVDTEDHETILALSRSLENMKSDAVRMRGAISQLNVSNKLLEAENEKLTRKLSEKQRQIRKLAQSCSDVLNSKKRKAFSRIQQQAHQLLRAVVKLSQ